MADELTELLAQYSHDVAWSGWMKFMFAQGTLGADGTWTMPADKVQRWTRQMNTPFKELQPKEQASDFEQAEAIRAVIRAHSADVLAREDVHARRQGDA